MNTPRWAALAICASLFPSVAHAGAWTRDAGSFYVNLAYQRIGAGQFYGPDFTKIPIRPYVQQSVSAYAEVGVVPRWLTLLFDGVLYRRNTLEGQGFTDGLSDIRIGAWTGLITKPVRLSFGLIVGLPTGDSLPKAPSGSSAAAQEVASVLPTGDGEADVEARFSFGHSFGATKKGFWPLRHFVQLDAGYWLRTKGYADGVTWAAELGTQFPYPVIGRLWFIFKLFGVESFASNAEAAANFTGLGNGVTFTAFGLQVFGRIWRGLGAFAQVDGAFRARGVAAGANLRFGLSWER
jgi:hypothetical protein